MTTSTALGRDSICTRIPLLVVVTTAPASTNLSSGNSRSSGLAPTIVMSPFVIAAANAQVPVTIRSGIAVWSTGFKVFTPVIVKVGEPKPSIFAPIEINICPRSTISGSRAALSIIVTPFASTDAVNRFSVAPTLGKSK